ncbi:MAG: hypothetical protein A3I11_01345 [Elusimicrobia bacterium RIFCSPLOWO2_02_FULL_39_32]|nr:MAG: hypothetical protein A2034_06085 [Elusimicrobia bacterium GWA2_38_7]OGR78191.1 MAG: hypothetical protein A3B80_05830 [Elusimicrobia bacterium RIFCSPHIGHO2_02_FULL_39_36]OGR92328.1 MAG: hypothetical protein A3I11_01345 [Elusimicrobia bacterium RIFCSPLOWO2_02_FULL_39_32]
MKKFVQLIEEKMKEKGISLRKVAKEIEVDPSFFSKVLSGKRTPPGDEKVLKKLALFLGLDPLELIISTGRIPEELRSFMESSEFLKMVEKRFPHLVFKAPEFEIPIEKEVRQLRIKSQELSEDLL